jgi:hypothetical protein
MSLSNQPLSVNRHRPPQALKLDSGLRNGLPRFVDRPNYVTGCTASELKQAMDQHNGCLGLVSLEADSHGRGCQEILQSILGPDHKVTATFKPNAGVKNVVGNSSLKGSSRIGTHIIMAGTNDAEKLSTCSTMESQQKQINETVTVPLLNAVKNYTKRGSNVIVTSIPVKYANQILMILYGTSTQL